MTPPILTAAPVRLEGLIAAVADAEHGGIATFLGTTRREAGAREFRAIEYSAYPALAEAEIAAIAAEARERFGAVVRIQHRTGLVAVGEASVAIAASAPHRAEAFAACRYAIDELKARAPIWKRAHFADGTTAWFDEHGTAHTAHDPPGT
jgi:molybdopterin synthase catalytic subunit